MLFYLVFFKGGVVLKGLFNFSVVLILQVSKLVQLLYCFYTLNTLLLLLTRASMDGEYLCCFLGDTPCLVLF